MDDERNPAPRPMVGDSRAEEIKALCRDHAELAIETLVDVMGDEDAKDAAKVKAADIILQRGFGAPERKVETKMDVHIYDERAAHLSALQRLAEMPRVTIDVEPNSIPASHSRARLESGERADPETIRARVREITTPKVNRRD